jgi:hypothetical protein
VNIEVTEVAGVQDKLLEAFGECQAGRCSCPTDEYQKLASMEVEQETDTIRLRLHAKPGERFDTSEIAACLDYTTAKAAKATAQD